MNCSFDSSQRRRHFFGAAHILFGVLLLPLSLMFGFLLAPLLVLGPLWMIVLGCLLWRSGANVQTLARRTHFIVVGFAVVLCIHGVLSLQAAARSASEGGGLLGAYGLIPLAYGLLIGAVSGISLLLTRSRPR